MVDERRGKGSNRFLNLVTPTFAFSALICLIMALCTPNWLYTKENMKNRNRTIVFGPNIEPEYLSKLTTSGLWVICITHPGSTNYSCIPINYFPKEKYRPDDQDSTMAIPYTARKSSTYFLFSFILMLNGEFFCFTSFLKTTKKIFSFISGVSFIVGGLIILMGIINYISIFKAEVGNKLYARSMLALPVFSYSYGYSFIILLMSFLLSEIAGICAIFQFIYHHQHKWDEIEKSQAAEKFKTSECLLEEKVNGEGTISSQCKLHSSYTNGHVIHSKDLEDTSTSEGMIEQYRELKVISSDSDSKSPNIQRQQSFKSDPLSSKINGCLCVPKPIVCHHNQPIKYINSENRLSLSEYINSSEPVQGDKHFGFPRPMDGPLPCCQVVFVPRQPTMSSMNTDTTGFNSSLCSPSYPVGFWDSQMGGNCSLSLDGFQMNATSMMTSNAQQNNAEDSVPEPKRNRMTRHISIDDQPITHTYHQNSLEDSSEMSQSTSEESSGSHRSTNSSGWKSSLKKKQINGPLLSSSEYNAKNGFSSQPISVIPSLTNGKLKSSLSKPSSLKQGNNFSFESQHNLQLIVKQKRENCLQNGIEMTTVNETCGGSFEEETTISQV